MAAAEESDPDLRRTIEDVLRAYTRAQKDGLIQESMSMEMLVDAVEQSMHTLRVEIPDVPEIRGKCKIRPKPKAIVKIDGSLLKRVHIGKRSKSLVLPFLPRLIDYSKCCGNILYSEGLYTPCLTRITKNKPTCKPCIGRIERKLINGSLDERMKLRKERKHFIGRADFGVELSYEDYLLKMHYFGTISDVNDELKQAGIPLVIPKSPKWLTELIDEKAVPTPLPGEMAEYDMLNEKDMLFCDSDMNLYIKKGEKYTTVGREGTTGIEVIPGMQKYFEPEWESEDSDLGSGSESEMEKVCADLIMIDDVKYAITSRDDGKFDIYSYDPNNPTVGEPVGILNEDKESAGFFDT